MPGAASSRRPPGYWIAYMYAVDGVVPIIPGMSSYPAARRQLDLFLSEMARGDSWSATVRILHDPDFDNSDLWPLRDMELAVASAARVAERYPGDEVQEFADRLKRRVTLYVR